MKRLMLKHHKYTLLTENISWLVVTFSTKIIKQYCFVKEIYQLKQKKFRNTLQ